MKERILSLDVCRGFMLFSMTFNHLIVFDFIRIDFLYAWICSTVYGTFGYLSNSEGFFFLAGLTAGIVYGRLLFQGREPEIRTRIWKRIGWMYGIFVILLLGFTLLVALNQNYLTNWKTLHTLIRVWIDQPGIHYFLDHPFAGFSLGCAFLYLLPFLDLFPLYILFLGLTPFLLNQLKKGRLFYVLLISLICWVLAQYDSGISERFLQNYLPAKLSWFHPCAIQILFVSGLIFGFFYAQDRMPNIHKVFLGTAVLLFTLLGWLYLTGAKIQNPYNLGILRLMTFACKAYIGFLIHRFLTFKPLALLGKHALPVFVYHIAFVYFLVLFLPELSLLPTPFKLICLSVALATVWIPAYISSSARRSERRMQASTEAPSR